MKNDYFGKNLVNAAGKYGNMVLFSADFSEVTGLREFSKVYGGRYFNFGLAEANMVSAGCGFAVRGKMPVIVGKAGALVGKALEQIRDGICLPNLNVKIIGVDIDGKDTTYRMFDSWDVEVLRGMPNMRVLKPHGEGELTAAMEEMFSSYGPFYMHI